MVQNRNRSDEQRLQDRPDNYCQVLVILNCLIKGSREERAAIESNDLDELKKIGYEQEQLLEELKSCFPSREEVSAEQSRQLLQLLELACKHRTHNCKLLVKEKDNTGEAITIMSAGRRTLKAYHPFGASEGREEIYIKKKC